jgi:hypothetical protein
MPDFEKLMRYACHLFQASLPHDPDTDAVFALPYIFHFVNAVAIDIIVTSRGGLTRTEELVWQYIKSTPNICSRTADGKAAHRRPSSLDGWVSMDSDEKNATAFTLRDVYDSAPFRHLNEDTVRRALDGLSRKQKLIRVREGKGVTAVWTVNLRTFESDEGPKTPTLRGFDNQWLEARIRKLIHGESWTQYPPATLPDSNVRRLSFRTEDIVFDPQWPGATLLGLPCPATTDPKTGTVL